MNTHISSPSVTSIPRKQAELNTYHVVLSDKQLKKKPTGNRIFKELHQELDRTQTSEVTLIELMEEVTQGKTWKNGKHEKETLNENDWMLLRDYRKGSEFIDKKVELERQKKIELKHTRLAVLDVDDVLGKTTPHNVMKGTGAIAYYQTFSDGDISPVDTRMARYRLLFDLSETVEGKQELEHIQQHIKKDLLERYPSLNERSFGGKSNGIDNITKMFFGTNKSYEINDAYIPYNVSEVKEKYRKEKRFRELIQQNKKQFDTARTTTEKELLSMATFLGDMNGQLNHSEWTGLAIGLWNTAQTSNMNDEEVIEVLSVLDGSNQSHSYYLGFKRPLGDASTPSTAGTLIHLAIERGFKRTNRQLPTKEVENASKQPVTTYDIEQYINKADMLEVLKNNKRKTLLISDTNTGKTRASIEASRELLKEKKNAFIYIALPTQALARQIKERYATENAVLGNMNIKKAVNDAVIGQRLLVGTYDKTPLVIKFLKGYDIIIIADEIHKEVSDYGYRHKAINGLFDITENDSVTKFIGLTGTPSEIDVNSYDGIVKFELETPKVLADKLQFIEYGNAKHYDNITIKAIKQEVEAGNQVLAFVNNKKLINRFADALKKSGVNVETITADNRRSKTYRKILEEEEIEADVVLTTIVLADGININNKKNSVCMIAPSHYRNAKFYNVELIKQATNRFRKQYKKILIPFYVKQEIASTKEHPRAEKSRFNLEGRYNFLLESAELVKAEIQAEFEGNMSQYSPSIAEALSGLTQPIRAEHFDFERAYDNQRRMEQGLHYSPQVQVEFEELQAHLFTVDKRHIRHDASQEKETHYSLYPYAFRDILQESLSVLETETIQAHTYFLNVDNELSEHLKSIEMLEKKSNDEKRERMKDTLHKLLYQRLESLLYETGRLNESVNEWQLLKKTLHPMQYKALMNVIPFLKHEQAIHELDRVEKNAQVNELKRQFEALIDIESFQSKQTTITKLIYKEVSDIVNSGAFNSKKELDEVLDERADAFKLHGRYTIAKRKKLFKDVFTRFFVSASTKVIKLNGKTKRQSTYEALTIEHMADVRELTTNEIMEQYASFIYSKK